MGKKVERDTSLPLIQDVDYLMSIHGNKRNGNNGLDHGDEKTCAIGAANNLDEVDQVGEILVRVEGIKNPGDFERVIGQKEGPVANVVSNLHDNGKEVGVTWRVNEIIVFAARYKKVITAASVTASVAAGVTAGTLYLLHRKSHPKQ